MIVILRKTKDDESWEVEEVLEEQLAFQKHDGTLTLMVHHGTNRPYLAKELCEVYHQRKMKELSEVSDNIADSTKSESNNFKRGHRKSMFNSTQKRKIYAEHTFDKKSKCALARKYKCSEKTIRNIIKEFG